MEYLKTSKIYDNNMKIGFKVTPNENASIIPLWYLFFVVAVNFVLKKKYLLPLLYCIMHYFFSFFLPTVFSLSCYVISIVFRDGDLFISLFYLFQFINGPIFRPYRCILSHYVNSLSGCSLSLLLLSLLFPPQIIRTPSFVS